MQKIKADLLKHIPKSKLAEGPVWDHRNNTLWWVDILNGHLHSFNQENNAHKTYSIGQYIGAAIPCKGNGLVLAGHQGFYLFYPDSQQLLPIGDLQLESINFRFNDGKCDAMGRFWAGTMEIEFQQNSGNLYCLTKHQVTNKLNGIYGSNGIAWSLDHTKMYYIDTLKYKLLVFDFDLKTGFLSNGKALIIFEASMGYPDGMTIDENGNLWICFYDGSKVCCFDPKTGTEITKIETPVQRPTSCTFGGPKMDVLYITSAQKKGDTLGGSLFFSRPGVKGPTTNFYEQ
ncbi:MAG: SMP-30/gluconolactonase/LRE family protein [Flavobacteriaceae bacterium]